MKLRRTAGIAALVAGVAVTTAFGAGGAAQADGTPGPSPVVTGLSGPMGLDTFGSGFVVAETSGGEHPGQITMIDGKGAKHVLFDDAAVAGVTAGKIRVWSVTGAEEPPPDAAEQPQTHLRALRKGPYPFASVLKTHVKKGQTSVLADLMAYELEHNPDGQVQFDPETHQPYDALSNPFGITKYWKGLLVADGGANDVLLVNARTGKVSTFFVPPTVGGPDCPQSNPGTTGCDSVPTGVTVVGKSAYVSTFGGEGAGTGRIYKLNARNGEVQRVWDGLDAPTGVAVGRDGSVYFSQVIMDQVTRIAPDGTLTVANVPSPVGLTVKGDKLFATSGAFAAPGTGQIVELVASDFHAFVS